MKSKLRWTKKRRVLWHEIAVLLRVCTPREYREPTPYELGRVRLLKERAARLERLDAAYVPQYIRFATDEAVIIEGGQVRVAGDPAPPPPKALIREAAAALLPHIKPEISAAMACRDEWDSGRGVGA